MNAMKARILLMSFVLMVAINVRMIAQTITVTGVVTDTFDKSPMIGANVLIEDPDHRIIDGTVANSVGKYSIQCKPTDTLIFSFIGYVPVKVPVNNRTVINIKLVPSSKKLDEVVVVGSYKMRSLSYSDDRDKCVSSCRMAPSGTSNVSYVTASSNVTTGSIGNESYSKVQENGFRSVGKNPLSTFSIDVDKAAYSNVRRFLNEGQKPPADAVKIEEMINYFDYDYPQPADDHPFAIFTEMSQCPWQSHHKLLHIGIQGKKIATENLPSSNLVFLIDVSGSMDEENKLPLVKSAFKMLVNNLREKDRVAIVTYAGSTKIVLGSTPGNQKKKILAAIDNLHAGGSTAGGAGIVLAYQVARENFIKDGNNRVILATDGDFNVGASSDDDMETLITKERKSGVFLSCLGFGMGNYKNSKLETLADKGNGNHAYVDNLQEANKIFGNEFGGTLFTIAKDVKIQIEFNPTKVQAYRLVGYEKRMLNDEDFKDDTKDAGELGSGHTVTALYEIIPVGVESDFLKNIPDLKYQKPLVNTQTSETDELATIKMRYKKPDGHKSIELEKIVKDSQKSIEDASDNLKFSSAVAMFGMLLRNSEFKGNSEYQNVVNLANSGRGKDSDGYRSEFVRLVKVCSGLGNEVE